MSKRLVLLFCALFVLAASVPAFAAVQNIKVSGDILARYIDRSNFDLAKASTGAAATGEDEVGVFNSVTRLRVDADLTDNVQTVIRLINERNWDENDAASSDIDVDLAYVNLKEFLYSPLTLAVGRQELHFGNDMIIGDGVGSDPLGNAINSGGTGTNQFANIFETPAYANGAVTAQLNGDLSYRKAFDAIRATLNYDPLVLDIIFAKIDANTITGIENADDINLYGLNAGYKLGDKWNTLTEGYFWSKTVSGPTVGSATAATIANKADKTYTVGGRVSTNPTAKVNLQQELAFQGGQKVVSGAARERNAWASQTFANYIPGWKHNPAFGFGYTYLSGDAGNTATPAGVSTQNSDPDKTYHGWDPMFENQTGGRIINAEFAHTNAHNIGLKLQLAPEFLQDLTFRADWIYQAAAKAYSSGTVSANSMGNTLVGAADKKEVGQEIDLTFTYDYTEDVQFGLISDWFFPGKIAAKTAAQSREIASEAIASMKVVF